MGKVLVLTLPPDFDRPGVGMQAFCLCYGLHNIPNRLKTIFIYHLNGCSFAEV
jgi:hypothetical protein